MLRYFTQLSNKEAVPDLKSLFNVNSYVFWTNVGVYFTIDFSGWSELWWLRKLWRGGCWGFLLPSVCRRVQTPPPRWCGFNYDEGGTRRGSHFWLVAVFSNFHPIRYFAIHQSNPKNDILSTTRPHSFLILIESCLNSLFMMKISHNFKLSLLNRK